MVKHSEGSAGNMASGGGPVHVSARNTWPGQVLCKSPSHLYPGPDADDTETLRMPPAPTDPMARDRAFTPGPENWFAAQLKPNAVRIAQRNLDRQGIVHFAPRMMVSRRVSGRIVRRADMVFPGYVFVQFDPARPGWQAINATHGICRLVIGDRHDPRALPVDFMQALLAQCDGSGLLAPVALLDVGDRVEMVDGPFATLVGRIEALDRDGRVRVLMDLLGRETRVSAVPGQLRRIG